MSVVTVARIAGRILLTGLVVITHPIASVRAIAEVVKIYHSDDDQ